MAKAERWQTLKTAFKQLSKAQQNRVTALSMRAVIDDLVYHESMQGFTSCIDSDTVFKLVSRFIRQEERG